MLLIPRDTFCQNDALGFMQCKMVMGGSFKMLKNQIYLLQKTILTQCFGQRTSYSAEQLSNCTAGVKK